MTERGKNVVLAVVTICLTLLICEFGFRLWRGISPFDFSNFRDPQNVRDTIRYDAQLGWALKDHLDRADIHTLADGIRRNSPAQSGPRPGNILVVGASITEGFPLPDGQNWPAQLEGLIGRPVDNAAVVGYALDQMVLRAEQLLSGERPRLVLLGVGEPSIGWMKSSIVRDTAKPFFTVDDDVLQVHNIPVPQFKPDPFAPIKDALGYSAVIDYAMSRIDPKGWHPTVLLDSNGSPDPVDVSCRLLRRLQGELAERGVHAIFVVEPQWQEVVRAKSAPHDLELVEQCAREAGLSVVDTLAAWRADYQSDPRRVANYWEAEHRHFTTAGHRRLAELVAGALSEQHQSEAR